MDESSNSLRKSASIGCVNEIGPYRARDYGCFAFDPVYKQVKKLPPKPTRKADETASGSAAGSAGSGMTTPFPPCRHFARLVCPRCENYKAKRGELLISPANKEELMVTESREKLLAFECIQSSTMPRLRSMMFHDPY
jgi:hypothetical protein